MSRRNDRWLVWGVGLALATLAVILAAHPRRAIDLRVYLTAAERFWEGTSLYRTSDGAMPFKYAPQTAWLFLPLSFFPPRLAAALWAGSCALGVLWVAHRVRAEGFALSGVTLGLGVAALGHPLYLEFHYGQVDLAILLLLVVAFGLRERAGWAAGLGAGALIATAALLKAPAALVLLCALAWRDLRMILGFAGGLVLLSVPLVVRYGLPAAWGELQSWTALVSSSTAPWILGHNPQGLPTVLLQLLGSDPPSPGAMLVAQAAAFGLLGAPLLVWGLREGRLGRSDRFRLFAWATAATALASPLGWRANFCVFLPLVWLLLTRAERPGRAAVAALAAVGAAFLPWLWSPEAYLQVMTLRPFFVAGVLVLIVSWGRRLAEPAPGRSA